MASTMEHTVSYPFSVQRLWEVLSSEDYWRDLLEAINSSHGKLESFEVSGDTVTVAMQQGVPAEKLPSMVSKVLNGDAQIPRRNTFRLVGDEIAGEMTATVSGAPAKVAGAVAISGDPATTRYTADVDVSVPFVGSKIEKAIIDQLVELLDAEHEQTVSWEASHR
ncbi:DUF2505 domain-containing protein [Gordonia sp. Z-3]|jgi:hypothetical protein|uniref:DUF2505 domain-containing protein n=1 Tax=unclassified Gordonia (in: high G+C Gram-positive bacteria) TaxID=2657482 RepID=UPI000C607C6C|nr:MULTISPECIES: DUF2505 domain-containing protein [unclassified Gordonia (in: high G+C Gram-positive bacteria)]MAU81799.1 hypothetical protein [Gordonia sp. (in: high G+C Gram-positive bacteria)]MED5800509.1 DUF2505 domain-containing protein [Gordonia sp. Z-3]